MSRMIFCTRLQCQAEGLETAPYPGELGQRLYREISKAAWQKWQSQQTMLINERKLTMLRAEHRQLLEQEMIKFLFEGQDVQIAGYVPLSQ